MSYMREESENSRFENRWGEQEQNKAENPVQRYASNFPSEIKRAVSGIDGEKQYAIAFLLLDRGRLSFTELQEELDLHQQSLSDALDRMQRGSLLTRVEKEEEHYQSFYEITAFGEAFFDSLIDSLGAGDGEIRFNNEWVEDPQIHGAFFTSVGEIVRKGGSGQKVEMTMAHDEYKVDG